MKKIILTSLLLLATLWLASCGNTEGPLTEAEQAEKYNMTITEYKEMKDAAARMNMTIEEHMNMTDTDGWMDHSNMDMWDDSDMIEDDTQGMHMMEDWTMMEGDTHMDWHESEDVEDHTAEEHE